MTEATDTQDAGTGDEKTSEPSFEQVLQAGPDRALAKLATLMNVAGENSRLPLVLIVQGQIIGGDLIGGGSWFRKMTDQMVAATSGTEGEALRQLFAQEEALYADPEQLTDGFVSFLHLDRAYSVARVGTRGMGLVRVRLNQIGSWSLGAYEHNED